MNIFWLHPDPDTSARWMLESHIVKMPIEAAQMLSWAHIHANPDMINVTKKVVGDSGFYISNYNKNHWNNSCTKWVRESIDNYFELQVYFLSMVEEYKRRYADNVLKDPSKPKVFTKQWHYLQHVPDLPDIGPTPKPKAFKHFPQFLDIPDIYTAYRTYYKHAKILHPEAKTNKRLGFYYKDTPSDFMQVIKEL